MQATTITSCLDHNRLSGPSASTQSIHQLTSLRFYPLEWLPLHFKANLNPYCAYRVLKGLALNTPPGLRVHLLSAPAHWTAVIPTLFLLLQQAHLVPPLGLGSCSSLCLEHVLRPLPTQMKCHLLAIPAPVTLPNCLVHFSS